MASQLPNGTVTFLFTDVEGSTKLWQQFPNAMPAALAHHHAILNEAIAANGGYVFQIIGDAFCAAFHTASDGLDAALAAQRGLRDATWGETGAIRVRMALHTGMAEIRAGEFTSGEYMSGLTLSRAARLLSAGHGGQILLSLPSAELVRDHLPKDVTLRDMGARRLKDLIRPEQIFQICVPDLPADFAPLKTLDVHPHNLPVQLTSFIGREREMREVKQLLTATHLLTLTGAGGAGKTRLSLQVAADLIDEFPNGVWFVELAPLADPGLIPQTVAALLDLREEAGRSAMTVLSDYLRAKTTLLILDNCEHLIEACAKFADTLLRAAPRVKILATSREALGIAGETTYRVPSLSLPPTDFRSLGDFGNLTQYESVRLFIDRVLSFNPEFQVNNANAPAVAQICHRLDGIPLAIELAAARIKLLSVEQVAERLDDRFRLLTGGSRTALPRQQTLRAAIDWSFSLLNDAERVMLRRLSVFAGGWTLDAAEKVTSDEGLVTSENAASLATCHLSPVGTLDLLGHLVDKSLVIVEPNEKTSRYRLLETIRQYAREKLQASGELESLQDRHLDFFLRFAEELEPQLRRKRQQEYLDRLEHELDNLRAALEWSLRMHRDIQMLRLGAALYLFWRQRDFWSEAVKWFKLMLAFDATPEHEALRQRILAGAAYIAMFIGDLKNAEEWARACIESSQTNGERRRQGEAFTILGFVAWQQNDYAKAKIYLEQAVALLREIEDYIGVADAFHWLGHVVLEHGEYAQARAFFQDSYTRMKDFGDQVGLTLLLADLGLVSYLQEDYAMVRAYNEQNLALSREIGSKLGIAKSLNQLGDLARCESDYGRAEALYGESLSLFKEMVNISNIASVWHNLAHVRLSQGDSVQAAMLFNQALNEFRKMRDKKGVTECLMGLAGVIIQMGRSEKGARLLGACEKIKQETGTTWWPANHIAYKYFLSRLHEQLDDAGFSAAWAEGQKMTLEQAIDLAMKDE